MVGDLVDHLLRGHRPREGGGQPQDVVHGDHPGRGHDVHRFERGAARRGGRGDAHGEAGQPGTQLERQPPPFGVAGDEAGDPAADDRGAVAALVRGIAQPGQHLPQPFADHVGRAQVEQIGGLRADQCHAAVHVQPAEPLGQPVDQLQRDQVGSRVRLLGRARAEDARLGPGGDGPAAFRRPLDQLAEPGAGVADDVELAGVELVDAPGRPQQEEPADDGVTGADRGQRGRELVRKRQGHAGELAGQVLTAADPDEALFADRDGERNRLGQPDPGERSRDRGGQADLGDHPQQVAAPVEDIDRADVGAGAGDRADQQLFEAGRVVRHAVRRHLDRRHRLTTPRSCDGYRTTT